MNTQEFTYTEALARVEEIVASLESGACDIDQMATRIKEAQQLLTFCTKRLEEVDTNYKKLLDNDGQR